MERPATPGLVQLVGAGPGDPGLITRRGAEALARAEVVVYDHLVHPRLLDLAPADALRLFAGKHGGILSPPQTAINDLLVDQARQGRRVVRLKGGDPFLFGRGAEEAEWLVREGIDFEVIPGVTAGVGVAAYAGLPITHRQDASAVAFLTGHHEPGSEGDRLDWNALARFPGTLVIYMGLTRLRALFQALIREGKAPDTPAAVVAHGTLAGQTTLVGTLADLPDRVEARSITPPALVIVGEVVQRRPALAWFERRPLFGRRILITRPIEEGDRSASDLEALGAEVFLAPTVQILPLDDYAELDAVLDRLDQFDWLVFTSSNGVRALLGRLEERGRDLRALGSVRLSAIGPATAETLRSFHLRADLVPPSYRSESLAEALRPHVRGRRVLLARADRGRPVLKEELDQIADVVQVAVYRNADVESLPPGLIDHLAEGRIDWITVTSSAIVQRLFDLLPPEARGRIGETTRLASISPVTSEAAARLGWPVAVEARTHTWEGLVQALVDHARSERTGPAPTSEVPGPP